MFCAPSTETVESIDEGTRKMKLMIFSTMPTAAASVRPRIFAMTVMTRKATWMKPSCSEIGTPMRRRRHSTGRSGRKSCRVSAMPARPLFTWARASTTLMACEMTVPQAAPLGPIAMAPMKR